MSVDEPNVSADIVSRVRSMIFDRTLASGSRINQVALAAQLGVTVEEVRVVLSRLQLTRLVRIESPHNAFVEELSRSDLEEIYGMRELLESHAARLAAPNLREEDLFKLDSIERDLIAAAAAGEVERSLTLHQELHFIIYKASGSHHLLDILDQLWKMSDRFRQFQVHASMNRIREALHEIHLIVAACKRRDSDGLGWLIRFKLRQTRIGLRGRTTTGARFSKRNARAVPPSSTEPVSRLSRPPSELTQPSPNTPAQRRSDPAQVRSSRKSAPYPSSTKNPSHRPKK